MKEEDNAKEIRKTPRKNWKRMEIDYIPNTSESDKPVKKTRGRPPGSKNKPWGKEE